MGIELWSADRRFGLALDDLLLTDVYRICADRFPFETGGILIGAYNATSNLAKVSRITQAPSDSKAGRTWFQRGLQGLSTLLAKLWRTPPDQRTYYLGEWHLHPGAAPIPSQTDMQQMQAIADAEACHCPEPILLLVGGAPRLGWTFAAFVFRRGGHPLRLGNTGPR
jgi:integrative and conjugative element protein (TIGR02256 family)